VASKAIATTYPFQRLQLGAKAILEEQIQPTLTQSSIPNDGVYVDGFDADNSIFE
jgi:hypothetical protein